MSPDGALQPRNLPECGAPVSCHGDGWLWEPEGVATLSLPAHEDGWRDELWFPLGPPHGPGPSLFGRRKVMNMFYFVCSLIKRTHERDL